MAGSECARRECGGDRHIGDIGDRLVRHALWRACANRLTLLASGAVAGAGFVFQSGELCLLAVGGYAVAVAVDLRRATRWREAAQHVRDEPVALPSTCRYDDPVTRELLLRIERARGAREAAVARLSAVDRSQVRSLLVQTSSLEQLAVQMLDAFDRLTVYLGADPVAPLVAEQQRLERLQAAEPQDPEVRQEYQRALASVAQRLRSLMHLCRWRAILRGKLEGVAGALDAMPAALIETELRRSSAGLLATDLPVDMLTDELRALHESGMAMLEAPPANDAS